MSVQRKQNGGQQRAPFPSVPAKHPPLTSVSSSHHYSSDSDTHQKSRPDIGCGQEYHQGADDLFGQTFNKQHARVRVPELRLRVGRMYRQATGEVGYSPPRTITAFLKSPR